MGHLELTDAPNALKGRPIQTHRTKDKVQHKFWIVGFLLIHNQNFLLHPWTKSMKCWQREWGSSSPDRPPPPPAVKEFILNSSSLMSPHTHPPNSTKLLLAFVPLYFLLPTLYSLAVPTVVSSISFHKPYIVSPACLTAWSMAVIPMICGDIFFVPS